MIPLDVIANLVPTQEIFQLSFHPQFSWGVNRRRIISKGPEGVFVHDGTYPQFVPHAELLMDDSRWFADCTAAMVRRGQLNDEEERRRQRQREARHGQAG